MLHKLKILTSLAVMIIVQPQNLYAQDGNLDRRVDKLEREVRAVQRKVFPQGSDRFFEPEIKPETSQPVNSQSNEGSNSAVRDLLGRVNALEEQLATLTGQLEEQQFKMRNVESKLAELEQGLVEQKAAPVPVNEPANDPEPVVSKVAPASSARRDAVAAIEIPDTGNAYEDSYNYGFRLWDAKFYPEAQIQLQQTVEKFPDHPRASFARNLLGRAWLDDNKPTNAAKVFYDNYVTDPRGNRAPDSLFFLGMALTSMSELAKACEAYEQLQGAYPDVAEGRLAARLTKGRTDAKCN